MQPTLRHTPPACSFSTTMTFLPSWPRRIPATYPPGPEPMTTTSVCMAGPYQKNGDQREGLGGLAVSAGAAGAVAAGAVVAGAPPSGGVVPVAEVGAGSGG